MMFTVAFEKRDFSGPRITGLQAEVEALHWRAVGGPWKARVVVRAGSPARLWEAAELLRCGVTVFDELGPAWWGYVRAVEIVEGARRSRLDLADMTNDVMVRYKTLSPEPWGGADAWTGAAANAASAAEFGRKAGVYALGAATQAQAQAYRSTMLGRDGLPRMVSGSAIGEDPSVTNGSYAVLECWGWWETLDWLFYRDDRGMQGHSTAGHNLAQTGQLYGQSFTVGAESWKLTEIWLRVGKTGNPTDTINALIYSGTASAPALVGQGLLAYGLRNGKEITPERAWVRFVLGVPVTLIPNTTYWVLSERAGGADAANFYNLSIDLAAGYAGGKLMQWNGSAWFDYAPAGDLAFMVTGQAEQGSILLRMLGPGGAGCGQFLTTLKLDTSFGFDGIPYRDGKTRGRAEAEAVLKQGTLDGVRVLAQVLPDRSTRLYSQPAQGSAELTVSAAGRLRWRSGRRLYCSELAAGRWAVLGEVALLGGLLNGATGEVFVEACAWDAARGLHMEEEN